MNQKINEYLVDLTPSRNEFFSKMEEYAHENHVPIMEIIGMEALLQFLRLHRPTSILEVGSAIGYSSLRMSDALPEARIVTLERHPERIKAARSFIKEAGKESHITLLEGDALELADEVKKFAPFDAIFIDAAKGQYIKFFELFEPFLSPEGIIISDNVLFKEKVIAPEESIGHRRARALVRKIKHFNSWVMEHPDYHTVILPIGDGMAISKKKNK
ncbi:MULTISPECIES: O-methyltransferase [Bacillus]|uniref:O-methyltransferase n=1 Tax=Bacillus TaxID=1386 RepID=UPI0002F045F3|nr:MULTISPECIES: O-methyltransferase [Bacillus]